MTKNMNIYIRWRQTGKNLTAENKGLGTMFGACFKKGLIALCAAGTLAVSSCIDEAKPKDYLLGSQVEGLDEAQYYLLNGIAADMVSYNTWGQDEYTQDWGYPCQIFFREVCGEDIPVSNANYSYWDGIEACSETRWPAYYTFNYYYSFINNCNNLIGRIDPETASETSKNYLGCALAFRAMAYLDLARQFEFKKTGISKLDNEAEASGIWGLTVPITTEKTTETEVKNNPRAPYSTMYRFILTDLNDAEDYLAGYSRDNKTLPNLSVVYGLKARFWMELGTRFEEDPQYLQDMIAADANAATDGYDAVGVTTARECYQNARTYAVRAASGYSPMTYSEWSDAETGFNTPTSSWMWSMSVNQQEQIPNNYYNSFIAVASCEPTWGMARAFDAFRCIGSDLYGKIGDGDWRKRTWVDPADAGNAAAVSNYKTSLNASQFAGLPEYANLKFHPAGGNLDDYNAGLLVDMPLMRMEEMKFIEIEATARLDGPSQGMAALKDFINTYRYTDGSYSPTYDGTLAGFIDEMMVQKRIEFWGEGVCFFDYKRMNLQIRRKESTNYVSSYQINSVPGYVAPWMNYFILEYEEDNNSAMVPNPDVSGSISSSDEY